MPSSFECGPAAHRKINEIKKDPAPFMAAVKKIAMIKATPTCGIASRGIRIHIGIVLAHGQAFTVKAVWSIRKDKLTLLDIDVMASGPH